MLQYNQLVKIGEAITSIKEIEDMECVEIIQNIIKANSHNGDYPHLRDKVFAEIARHNIKKQSITGILREWVAATKGNFHVTDAYDAATIATSKDKSAVRMALTRMVRDGILEKHSKKEGYYRYINQEVEEIDWLNATIDVLPVTYPLKLHYLFHTMPKNIVAIAGSPDSGKTAFLLDFVRLNQHLMPINYISSEMGAIELKLRLRKFEEVHGAIDWKFKAIERAGDFADVIKPNDINIIDYMEIHEEHYLMGKWFKEVFDKLDRGIALIAIQKKFGSSMGVGGMATLEKPRLYMTMEHGVAKIEKCKNWANQENNPNKQKCEFQLFQGCDFNILKSWHKEE